MKKIIILPLLCALLWLLPAVHAASSTLIVERQTVTIANIENGLSVTEEIKLKNTGSDPYNASLQFWIQQNARTIQITAVNEFIRYPVGNVQVVNLSQYNISLAYNTSFDVTVSYILPADAETFEQTLTYDTTSLTITFNGRELYRGESVSSGASLRLLLYSPTGAPLNTTYILVVLVLVVILIASTLLLLKKQRYKAKRSIHESEELLTTKKALLLSLLKDLEKQHRSKTLSDDSYNKLKEEYKQQAVEVMKKLDDLKIT